MDAFHDLLEEIRRVQLLVCAYRNGGGPQEAETPLGEVVQELKITPEECGKVVRTLTAQGLLEQGAANASAGSVCVRLTTKGKEQVELMGRPLPARVVRATDA